MKSYFLLLFLGSALAQNDVSADVDMPCDPGYKLSKIVRENGEDGWGGPIMVECEKIPGDVQNPTCEVRDPLKCTEEPEDCLGPHEYLGGMKVFLLDPETGAYLFQPICCSADNVVLDMESCSPLRLNAYKAPFEFKAGPGKVFKDFLCFLMKDRYQTVHDAILKPNVCKMSLGEKPAVEGEEGAGEGEDGEQEVAREADNLDGESYEDEDGDGEEEGAGTGAEDGEEVPSDTCAQCDCGCGPYKCPDGTTLTHIVKHKRRKRDTCHCVCECNFTCLPDDASYLSFSRKR